MATDKDKRIRELEDTVTQLLDEIGKLKRRLGMDSTNSSKPPSSDYPGSKAKPGKTPKRKSRGARKGHPKQNKELVPEERLDNLLVLPPEFCPHCGDSHFKDSGEGPLRDQFIDLPPIKAEVREIRRPVLSCTACGTSAYAPLPDGTPKHTFGPGVVAMVGILTGLLHVSKRSAYLMMNEVFHTPISLGSISGCEKRLSAALAAPHEEALAAVQSGSSGHADETGWPLGNQAKGWLWVLSNDQAAAFMAHESRGQKAAHELLGNFSGTLISDRWGGYNRYEGRRQICWAHIRRDFKAVSEASSWLGKTGEKLYALSGKILGEYRRVREGSLQLTTFQRRITKWKKQLEAWLKRGGTHSGELAAKCREIWKCRQWLWTFVEQEDVEPTNNIAERDVRKAVLWRKGSFGVQSDSGARYVERILTVCATCHRQGKSVIRFLHTACECSHGNSPIPSLFG